jgi:hypothetical protein
MIHTRAAGVWQADLARILAGIVAADVVSSKVKTMAAGINGICPENGHLPRPNVR